MQRAHEGDAGTEPTAAQKTAAEKAVRGALLTREQVQELVPYQLAWARDYAARPFRWGYVARPGRPADGIRRAAHGADGRRHRYGLRRPEVDRLPARVREGSETAGPSSALLYGDGFGAIVLAQTRTTAELEKQLAEARKTSQILGKATVGGAEALKIGTPLGGVIVWEKDGTTLVAAGMVPMSDLEAFASSVR